MLSDHHGNQQHKQQKYYKLKETEQSKKSLKVSQPNKFQSQIIFSTEFYHTYKKVNANILIKLLYKMETEHYSMRTQLP